MAVYWRLAPVHEVQEKIPCEHFDEMRETGKPLPMQHGHRISAGFKLDYALFGLMRGPSHKFAVQEINK